MPTMREAWEKGEDIFQPKEYWRKKRMRAVARARKRSKKLRKRKGAGWKVAEGLLGGAYAGSTT